MTGRETTLSIWRAKSHDEDEGNKAWTACLGDRPLAMVYAPGQDEAMDMLLDFVANELESVKEIRA